MKNNHYDILIVGAGIAGCSLAHALSTIPRKKPFQIGLLERSLAEPDRIVGELLQPGGVVALKKLGLESCLEGIDAVPAYGYCVVEGEKSVHIPYPKGYEGRSFHHGRFIMALREAARRAKGVDVIEANVTELIENDTPQRVIGVRTSKKDSAAPDVAGSNCQESFYADLVVIADGCFSNFRNSVMGNSAAKPSTKSHFIGAILEDATLPIPKHGTVALVQGFGPVLLYQISEHDTRMLVDVKQPLPSDLKSHILNNVMPQLPTTLHIPIQKALAKDRLRRMPNSFLPPVQQGRGSKESALLLGDAWNMRHPLTGGGMTVAFNDVVLLQSMIADISDLGDWKEVRELLRKWHWQRKGLASTVNILSVALYDLFGADCEELRILRTGCFKYFELGGACVNDPVSLLAGIAPSPLLLSRHFFKVAFYSLWVLFTHPTVIQNPDGKNYSVTPQIHQYPLLFIKSISTFWTACVVFGPLVWSEIRWWAPSKSTWVQRFIVTFLLLGLLCIGTYRA